MLLRMPCGCRLIWLIGLLIFLNIRDPGETVVECQMDDAPDLYKNGSDAAEMLQVLLSRETGVIANYSGQNLTSVPGNIPENATELYLSLNKIIELPALAFQRLNRLIKLDVSSNRLLRLDKDAFVGLKNLRYLILNRNVISVTLEILFQRILHPLVYLYELDLEVNRIESEGPDPILFNSHLKFVNLGRNHLTLWHSPVVGAENMERLILFDNDCSALYSFFVNFTALKTLRLGHNRLGKALDDFTFYYLTKLEVLDLSYNGIQTVSRGMFSRLKKLTLLDLSGNAIISWTGHISSLTNLELLDLSWNTNFRSLPQNLCSDLDYIRNFSDIAILLASNHMYCDCNTQYFVHWLTVTHVTVLASDETFCYLSNGTKVALSKSESTSEHLKDQCRSYVPLIAGVSAVLALSVCITIGGLVRRYRWKLRYLYYMAAKRGERTGYQRLDGADENPFAYDAFFSYYDSDRGFIIENVLPKLETEAGLRLCIDKRDFTPGLYVTENIMNAIQNSNKTVVLLSNEFLKSKWCMYEMNMARMESLYNGRETLVVVMMEGLEAGNLSAEVLEILHSQSYIEKVDDPIGEDLFWRRLVAAIK